MVEKHYSAFLSCSFAPEDKTVVDFFSKLIKSFDIDPNIYDYQEIGALSDKIRENIAESDCMIAIATRRMNGKISDKSSHWIHDEIATARAYKKPIALFYEEGVRIKGLIQAEERQQVFNRKDLVQNIGKIVKFLFKMRKHLESLDEPADFRLLSRRRIRVKDELLSREIIDQRVEVEMESRVDGLDWTYHSTEVNETTPGLSIRPTHFEFSCKEKPSGTKVAAVQTVVRNGKFSWRIAFNPPLKRGEGVKYAYTEVRPNHRSYTIEELQERIAKGNYKRYNDEEKVAACDWFISYPTLNLEHEFHFPANYDIENCVADVTVGRARVKDAKELKRVKDGKMFTAEKIFGKWVLKLKVEKPLLNHTYSTYYTPSKSNSKSN